MKDFSDQFHLKTEDVEDVVNLLERAHQKGYVLQQANDQTSFFLLDRDSLAQFSGGFLLLLVRTSDALYWTFSPFDKVKLGASYSVEDYFEGIKLKKVNLSIETLIATHSVNEEIAKELRALSAIAHSTEAEGAVYTFSEIVGLKKIESLSYEYVDCDLEDPQTHFEGIFCFDPHKV